MLYGTINSELMVMFCTLLLFSMCRNLIDMDVFSKSDPSK